MDAHPGCDGVTKFAEKAIRSSFTAPPQLMHISTGQVITLHPYKEKLLKDHDPLRAVERHRCVEKIGEA